MGGEEWTLVQQTDNCNLLFERNRFTCALFWHLYGKGIASNLIYRYVMIGKQSICPNLKSVILVCARVRRSLLKNLLNNLFDETKRSFREWLISRMKKDRVNELITFLSLFETNDVRPSRNFTLFVLNNK